MTPEEIKSTLEAELGISFTLCESSNIVAIGYNNNTQDLWVAFKRELVYCYPGVSKAQFKDLQSAESKGKWINANLVKSGATYKKYVFK